MYPHTVLHLALLIAALIVFILAFIPVSTRNLVALGLAILAASFLFGCAGFTPQPVSVRTGAALLTSQAIQFGIKDVDKPMIAAEFTQGAEVFASISAGGVPTPEGFQALLEARLPANATKKLVVADLTSLYRDQYAGFQPTDPQPWLKTLGDIAQGIKDGASPFLAP